MNLREVRDLVAERLSGMPEVRRVYARLGHPPRIRVDLKESATPADDEAVRKELTALNCPVQVDINFSGSEDIKSDNFKLLTGSRGVPG